MNKDLLTVDDLCREIGVGKNTAYNLIKTKKIGACKCGQRYLIHKKELDRYINENFIGKQG